MPWLNKPGRRRPADLVRSDEGAAILEFALALPVLIAAAAGTYEVGRAIRTRASLEGAVRAGARYLSRVPDPYCRPGCSPGAAHAVALTTDQIVESTGLPAARVSVAPDRDPPAGTVAMTAEADLGGGMPSVFGMRPSWTVRVTHREGRVAE